MLSRGKPQNLQYVANAAFLASLFVDYMNATGVPGWNCGPNYVPSSVLRSFATSQVPSSSLHLSIVFDKIACCMILLISFHFNLCCLIFYIQMDYILGKNPMNVSYVAGYGTKFPRFIHHRGASTPNDHKYYSCSVGWKWQDSKSSNPNNITGAMVGGPDQFDQFHDVRTNYNYTEPTLAGNAGLVAALVSLTTTAGTGIDINSIFSAVPPLYPQTPSPPPPWKP